MNIRAYAVAMAAYNAWMNDKLFAVASTLTDDERKRDLGAFFRSVHGTLNHLLLVDEAWLQRFARQPVTMTSTTQEVHGDFDALRSAREAMDRRITAWAATLDPALADETLEIWSVSQQRTFRLPAVAAVLQLFNHQTHHRGQVTTLLKQLGRDPGITDIAMMPFFHS